MFNAEHLQESGLLCLMQKAQMRSKIHIVKRSPLSCQKTKKILRDEQSFSQGGTITEASPTNSANAAGASGGFGGSATAAGPTAGFDPVLISLIRRSMPNLVAYDLAGVQPMSGPTGLIFAMRSRYKDQSGTETFYNEVDTAFSGQSSGNNLTSGISGAAAGLGTTSQSGSNLLSTNFKCRQDCI